MKNSIWMISGQPVQIRVLVLIHKRLSSCTLIRRHTDDANNLIDAQQCLQQPLHNTCPRFYLVQQMRQSMADRIQPKIKKAFKCRSEGESLWFHSRSHEERQEITRKTGLERRFLFQLLNTTAATAFRFNSMTTKSNNGPGTPTLQQLGDTHLILSVPS